MKRTLPALLALASCVGAHAAIDAPAREFDACSDFYSYANAKWLDATRIPDDRSRWSTFDIIGERNTALLTEAFAAEIKDSKFAAASAQRKVVDYYASGLDLEGIERAGLKPLEALLEAIDRTAEPATLSATVARLQQSGS